MKNVILNSGSVKAETGNLSGYSLTMGRIHVFGKQLIAAGIDPTKVTFPLYAIVKSTKVPQRVKDAAGNWSPKLGADGQPLPDQDRLTAVAVFKTKADLIKAHVSEALLGAEADQEFAKEATALGLTAEAAAKLVAGATF